jgi:hypothetical protein
VFHADGKYELGELMPAVLARSNEPYGEAADAAESWGNETSKAAVAERKAALAHALPRQQAPLRRLCPQAALLSEGAGPQILRSIHEGARDMARAIATTDAYVTSRRERKKIEMLFAYLKRILRLDRLRLRGPNGARDEFHLAATAQNLRKLAKLIPMPA